MPDFEHTWKRQLFLVWVAQFVCHIGFAFGLPFAPFYLLELGVTEADRPFWVALFGASAPLAMMIFAPVWGALADRFGRRKMLLRSYLGGVVAIGGMSLVTSPEMLIALRILQGMFCGTVSAAQTLISTQTPEKHTGFALGALHSAFFSGQLAGAFLGGIVAEYCGYRISFVMSGILMGLAFLLVCFGVKEYFKPPEERFRFARIFQSLLPEKRDLLPVLPILGLMAAVMYTRCFDMSFLPIFVEQINGSIEGASLKTGLIQALCSTAGVCSGFLLGYLSDRFPAGWIALISTAISGLFMLILSFSGSILFLAIFRFGMVFAGSGIDPALQIWLSRRSRQESRGLIFGFAATCRSLGMTFAPLAAGLAVRIWDVRGLYVIGPIFYLAVIFMIYRVLRSQDTAPVKG